MLGYRIRVFRRAAKVAVADRNDAGEAMNRFLLIVIGNWLALSACAGDIDVAPSSPLKVDLNNVVETGVVQPVNGITAAGQPDEAALAVFAKNGYAAVLDLRTAGEDRGLDERAVVEGLGMDYVLLPVDRDGISFENAEALDKLIRSYDAPVLVHCASSNRVGALLALRASLGGADDAAALEIGKQGGLKSLEGQVREILDDD
jgi:uncharacterized protein (TIGR01244 family)